MKVREKRVGKFWPMLLCIVLSLLLHLLVLLLLMLLPESPRFDSSARQNKRPPRALRVLKPAPKKQPKPDEEKAKPPAHRPFAKTNPDEPEQLPREADHVGSRNTVGRSEREPDSSESAPHMDGEERDEVNPLNQERQDGDLASEKLSPSEEPGDVASDQQVSRPQQNSQPQDASHPAELTEAEQNRPVDDGESRRADSDAEQVSQQTEQQTQQQTETSSETPSRGSEQGKGLDADQNQERPVSSPEPLLPDESALEKFGDKPIPLPPVKADDESPKPSPAARPGVSDAVALLPDPNLPPPAQRGRPVYDPSLPSSAQPGFRTYERRSRSSGTFICGRQPSMNVQATPRGRYEAEVFRRIVRAWYFQCDEHRGAILPGTLTISVCLTSQGRIHNLQLLTRRGAGVVQQSFTFKAIRQASLPPMPESVKRELGENLLELVILFMFD